MFWHAHSLTRVELCRGCGGLWWEGEPSKIGQYLVSWSEKDIRVWIEKPQSYMCSGEFDGFMGFCNCRTCVHEPECLAFYLRSMRAHSSRGFSARKNLWTSSKRMTPHKHTYQTPAHSPISCLVGKIQEKWAQNVSASRDTINCVQKTCKHNTNSKNDITIFRFQYFSQISDFGTRLSSWPSNKSLPSGYLFSGVYLKFAGLKTSKNSTHCIYGEFLLPGQGISLVVKTGICSQKLESKNSWTIFTCPTLNLGLIRHFGVFSRICGHIFALSYAFCIFCDQAKSKQTPDHPIKIRHMAFSRKASPTHHPLTPPPPPHHIHTKKNAFFEPLNISSLSIYSFLTSTYRSSMRSWSYVFY